MADDESEKSAREREWKRKEWKYAREEAIERARIKRARKDLDLIVDKCTTGKFKHYLLSSARKRKSHFRPGITREQQLAEEYLLRTQLAFAAFSGKASGKEASNLIREIRKRLGHKVVNPDNPQLFKFERYIDFGKLGCPLEDLLKIANHTESLANRLEKITAAKLINESGGRQKIRPGKESYNLKFVCFVRAFQMMLEFLADDPVDAARIIDTKVRKPFEIPSLSEWIRLSGISRKSFHNYWNRVMATTSKDFRYIEWAVETIPMTFHDEKDLTGMLTEKERNRLQTIRNYDKGEED
jgi:hypothetical protein